MTWGRASILLTQNEKLIARHILAGHLQGLPLPGSEDIATVLDIAAEEAGNGIQMLIRLGFLTLQETPPISGYALAEDADSFHEGLGFSFHTVTMDDNEQFGIP